MKTTKVIMIFLFSVFILTGCNNKQLSCTKKENIESGTATEKQIITFENNKINSYSAEMAIKLNDDYKDYADMLLDNLATPFKKYQNKDGVKYNISKKDNIISITFNGDYTKMDDNTKDSLGISEKASFDKIKTSLEKDGYTCK